MKSGVQPWIGCGSKAGWLAAGAPSRVALLGVAAADELRIGGLARARSCVSGRSLRSTRADAGHRAAGAVAGDEVVEPSSRRSR